MTQSFVGSTSYNAGEHQVLTLDLEKKLSWRMIKCDIKHSPALLDYRKGQPIYDGICINGLLYYLAYVSRYQYDGFHDIVCFDIRSEKFSCIGKDHPGMTFHQGGQIVSTLVNYKGKLAKLQPNKVNGIYTGIELWVLEDAQKHQWSSYIYFLPHPWKTIYEEGKLCFVGEIVLSLKNISDSFYLLYYNPETDTITTVEIQGMEAFIPHRASIFLDHVENVKLMEIVEPMEDV